MFNRVTTDMLNWIIIIGVILFVLEIAFFHGGMIFSALFCGLIVYFGWKKFAHLWGKILFWFGVVGLVFAVLNMLAVRFLILAAVVLFLIHYTKTRQHTEKLQPRYTVNNAENPDPLIQVKPLFTSTFLGDQTTDNNIYQWRDINIHGVFGDREFDLSNTVLPSDTAVISIRHVMGNIIIYIPYEVEVSVQHSSVFGRANIMGKHHWKLINQSLLYQTKNYETATTRVKIITSVFSGDIEVKRI